MKQKTQDPGSGHITCLTCSAIYPSGLFWCELRGFGAISHINVCLLFNIMKLDDTRLVVLKLNSSVSIQKNMTLLSAILCLNHFSFYWTTPTKPCHRAKGMAVYYSRTR